MGEDIAAVIAAALEPFVTDTPCDGEAVQSYVSMTDPRVAWEDFACGALVSPWLVSYGPTAGSVGGMARSASPTAMPMVFEAHWQVEIREACYPMVQGEDQPVFPSLAFVHEVHRHVYAHGVAAYRAVWEAWYDGSLFPDAGQCPDLVLGPLLPIEPQGPVVGWLFTAIAPLP